MITFALTPHKVAIQEANELSKQKDLNKIRLFVDLRNSIPVFFDEEKVKFLLKDIETSVISFVESTLRFMEYCMLQFEKPVEFHFFYEVGRSEYHRKLNKEYKSNRHTSYLILSPDEVKQASDLNIKCFDAVYSTLQYAKNTHIYKIQYFEADFIPHYITREFDDENALNIILSNDKDMFQSITPDDRVILFKKDFRKKETRVIKFDNMYQELSKSDITIDSEHNFIADILAVSGDSSDGVPGIKGVGYVSALRLFSEIKIPLSELLNFDNVDSIIKEYNLEIKGRVLTTLKKIIAEKELVENNRKQVDYDIIMQHIPFNTKKNIKESLEDKYDFDKLLEDVKFIRSDFTSLLSMMFPEKIDELQQQYINFIEDGVYQEYSVDRSIREKTTNQNVTNPNEHIELKDANILGFLL